jgi:hypothetical protein
MNNNQMNRQRIDGDRVRMRMEAMINRMCDRILNEIESRLVDLLEERLPDLVMESFPTIVDDLMERLEDKLENRIDDMETRILNRHRESMENANQVRVQELWMTRKLMI